MPLIVDLPEIALVTLPRASLATLRASLLRDAGTGYATYLQEAGYAGGEAVFSAFARWLAEHGHESPEALPVGAFRDQVRGFFRAAGWGSLTVSTLGEHVAVLDSEDWAEADPSAGLDHPGCHFSTGLFADVFGRVADAPLAVLEVECRSMGYPRCRFLMGSADVMTHIYGRMSDGGAYDAAIAELG